MVGRA